MQGDFDMGLIEHRSAIALSFATALAVLATAPAEAREKNRRGTQAVELDPQGKGVISGIGIDSRDIDRMADQAVREIMSRADLVATAEPPRVVVDSEAFYNDSIQRIDRNMITDALRASLNRAAAGKIRFISREAMALVMRERELKRTGVADVGTRGMTAGVAGLDFQMIGRMTSLDLRDSASGLMQRRTQVVFELVDMETGELPWTSQPYIIMRAAGDDVVYR
jgi:hypothetical protein